MLRYELEMNTIEVTKSKCPTLDGQCDFAASSLVVGKKPTRPAEKLNTIPQHCKKKIPCREESYTCQCIIFILFLGKRKLPLPIFCIVIVVKNYYSYTLVTMLLINSIKYNWSKSFGSNIWCDHTMG